MKSAILLIKKHSFSTVLLDLGLPDGDGLSLIKGIKNKIISQSDITELGAIIGSDNIVCCGENQITVADLTGVAVQDIQIAKAVYEACERLD